MKCVSFKIDKRFGELIEMSRRDAIYIYPAEVQRGLIGGLGVIKDRKIIRCIRDLDRGIFKFYNLKTCIPFLFLTDVFYFKKTYELFGLTPFVLKGGQIVYYANLTNEEVEHLKNCGASVEDRVCAYYDPNINALNPLLQLIDNLEFEERELLKKALKLGFLSKWFDLTKEWSDVSRTILSKFPEFTSIRHFQKKLIRTLTDFINRHRKLFNDLYPVSISSNPYSALTIIRNAVDVIRNPEVKERIKFDEFQPTLEITGMELHFKLTLPSLITAIRIREALKEVFSDARILSIPRRKREELLYRFSVKFETDFPYHDVDKFITSVNKAVAGIIDSVKKEKKEDSLLTDLARFLIWIKKIWFRITTPPHFRDVVLDSLHKTGWILFSLNEKTLYKTLIIEGEAWCDYQIYKIRRSSDRVLKSVRSTDELREVLQRDDIVYAMVAHKDFLRDCMTFFTELNKNLSNIYPDTLLI
jgi:hypothetical protein